MARATESRKLEKFIPAMLAKETNVPFSHEDWIYEIKWDGYRAIAEVKKQNVKLYSRNGNSFLSNFPIVADALAELSMNAVLDGEIIVLNEDGNPDFQKLQHYDQFTNYPLQFYVFDLLELNGKKLYNLPLIERKELLEKNLQTNQVIKYSDHIEEDGEGFFDVVKQKNLEGIMAKKKTGEYYPGKRSADWLKIKHNKSDEAIIAGFTAPRGGRKHFGALVLASFVNGKLTYIGHTGSGFDTALLKELYAKLQPIITETSPFSQRVKTNMPVTWVEPMYVCEIKFTEWTSDGKLRHPIFLRLRDDKTPQDVNTQFINANKMKTTTNETSDAAAKALVKKLPAKVAKESTSIKKSTPVKKIAAAKNVLKKAASKKEDKSTSQEKKVAVKAATSKAKTSAASDPSVIKNEKEKVYTFGKAVLKSTNRTKIFFPDDGITKGDVLDYYEVMAPLILPHLKDRPESLFRTPNGINAKGFFHKDAGDDAPSWVQHIPVHSGSVKKDIEYILCNNAATLLYLANLGCIEINPWHSRVKSLDKPDYLIIDIDPSDNNSFDQVIEAALVVKQVLDQAGAMGICKTSGASGMHIYIPLGAKYTYDQAKDFANIVCMMASAIIPSFTTLERNLNKRGKDHIYMDYLQNRKGQTIACVYSLRPKKGATVSTPLDWSEVKKGLTPQDFTIRNVAKRVKSKGDLFAPLLDKRNAIDLNKCIERLGG